jgi:hypothetical protein
MLVMDPQELALSRALLAFIRSSSTPTASSIIERYAGEHPEIDPGDIRVAMMRLLSAGDVSVGPEWRLITRAQQPDATSPEPAH